jgi:iron(III) transport system ATP-binding protein
VNLGGYESRKSSELSGGQQQRVALARSLVVEPDILLFDEPLSNLDAKLRESMRIEIRRLLTRLGITALYVTHDQIESMSLSDRVVVMSKGRIEQIGTPVEIYNSPKTKFVADFMGWTNFIEAEIASESDGKLLLKAKDFEIKVPRRAEIQIGGSRTAISLIRPEDIRFSDSGVAAKVLEATFLGDRYEVLVALASGAKLTARVKRNPKDPSFASGDQVHLTFQETQLSYLAA